MDKKRLRVLVVGDLHAPFIQSGYLRFCKRIYKKYKCNTVIFIGDLIDNHYSSFHDTDPDGHSAGEELRLAKKMISKWYESFPYAYVCIGNHDAIPDRKRFKAGISKHWIKSVADVLNVPTWRFADEWIFDGVKYVHGTNRKARSRMLQDMCSIVQGHYHSESYIHFNNGVNDRLFAMQIGCGIDGRSYAMEYGKNFGKLHINCGIVIDGKLPILEYM